MNFNIDDPKWTAYVLGELSESERLELERELESSEEARAFVDELRTTTAFMKEELAKEAVKVLTFDQRGAVHAAATRPARTRTSWFAPSPTAWAAAGLAAACLLLAVLAPSLLRQKPAAPEAVQPTAARHDTSEPVAKSVVPTAPKPAVTVAPVRQPTESGLRYQPAAPDLATAATEAILPAPAAVVAPPQQVVASSGRTPVQLRGVVQDASKAVLPGVTVVVTNAETGVAQTSVSNDEGVYSLIVTQGVYKVTSSLRGFKKAEIDKVQMRQEAQNVDITLEVGRVDQTVTVIADANAALRESSASVGEVLPEYRIRELPLVGNNVLDLVKILPGYRQSAVAGADTTAGLDTSFFNTTVNGMSVTDGNWANISSDGVYSVTQLGQQGQQGQMQDKKVVALEARLQPPPPSPTAALAPPPTVVPSVIPAVPAADRPVVPSVNTEVYDQIIDNPFLAVSRNQLSTFGADVDTASYSNIRRMLGQMQLPPKNAVRIEEMINYFSYAYPQPSGSNPIGASIEVAAAPWNPQHRLVRVGIKAREVDADRRPASNLVFLIDVSGSMQPQERLPLLKTALRMLVAQLSANDRVTIVTYASTTGVALPPTRGDQKDTILGIIDSLQAGGSTNGGSGIQLAYGQAAEAFIRDGSNRVILATDGDFNVGVTDRGELLRLIEERAKTGVFLTVLGVGMGNFKDGTLETLADKGNGNYAYLDTLNEAKKVLVDQMSGTLVTVAKDVKLQVEFNPATVNAYRLIGYENRALRNEDFNNDRKDAGDMGAGHTVTALYEIVPKGVGIDAPGVDALRYQLQPSTGGASAAASDVSSETLVVKIRYKEPEGTESKLLEFPLVDRGGGFTRASSDFRFAAAVASFGMILRDSPHKGTSSIDAVIGMVEDSLGDDRNGYRREFQELIRRAQQIRGR